MFLLSARSWPTIPVSSVTALAFCFTLLGCSSHRGATHPPETVVVEQVQPRIGVANDPYLDPYADNGYADDTEVAGDYEGYAEAPATYADQPTGAAPDGWGTESAGVVRRYGDAVTVRQYPSGNEVPVSRYYYDDTSVYYYDDDRRDDPYGYYGYEGDDYADYYGYAYGGYYADYYRYAPRHYPSTYVYYRPYLVHRPYYHYGWHRPYAHRRHGYRPFYTVATFYDPFFYGPAFYDPWLPHRRPGFSFSFSFGSGYGPYGGDYWSGYWDGYTHASYGYGGYHSGYQNGYYNGQGHGYYNSPYSWRGRDRDDRGGRGDVTLASGPVPRRRTLTGRGGSAPVDSGSTSPALTPCDGSAARTVHRRTAACTSACAPRSARSVHRAIAGAHPEPLSSLLNGR